MARLLFIRPEVENGRWVGSREKYGIEGSGSGSILIVDRTMREVREEDVRSVCKSIEEVVIPLISEETAKLPNGRQTIVEAVESAADKYVHTW